MIIEGMDVIVLAAGLGTRFGGLKQLAPVGPRGEALLDYTIRDALGAGFDRLVLVVRREIEAEIAEHVARVAGGRPVVVVRQDDLGPPREKPWGTVHAVLACRGAVRTPFAVVNADDVYGAASLRALAEHLRGPAFGVGRAALVGFRLDETLSPGGGVSRGVCEVGDSGALTGLAEHRHVRRSDGRIVSDGSSDLPADILVSMNLWGFHPSVLADFAVRFETFAARHHDDQRAEYALSDAVGELVADGLLRVAVLPTEAAWIGITFPDDLPRAREILAARDDPARPGTPR